MKPATQNILWAVSLLAILWVELIVAVGAIRLNWQSLHETGVFETKDPTWREAFIIKAVLRSEPPRQVNILGQ